MHNVEETFYFPQNLHFIHYTLKLKIVLVKIGKKKNTTHKFNTTVTYLYSTDE